MNAFKTGEKIYFHPEVYLKSAEALTQADKTGKEKLWMGGSLKIYLNHFFFGLSQCQEKQPTPQWAQKQYFVQNRLKQNGLVSLKIKINK